MTQCATGTTPPEILAVLPRDAPLGHVAYQKVQLSPGGNAVDQMARFTYGRSCWQATLQEARTSYAAERIARAMYVMLAAGKDSDSVLKFRKSCYNKITRAVSRVHKRHAENLAAQDTSTGACTPESAKRVKQELLKREDATSVKKDMDAKLEENNDQGDVPTFQVKTEGSDKEGRGTPQITEPPVEVVRATPTSCKHGLARPDSSPTVAFGTGVKELRSACCVRGVPSEGSWIDLVLQMDRSDELTAEAVQGRKLLFTSDICGVPQALSNVDDAKSAKEHVPKRRPVATPQQQLLARC